MNKLDIKDVLITNFLDKNFKNEANILLFGSNVEGYNKNSDIDILIISHHLSVFTKEVCFFENQLFDVTIIPFFEIHAYLEKDKFLKVYMDIFEKGKIIYDKNDIIKKIITESKSNKLPENIFLRKIQVEKNLSFFIRKMIASTNIYEAEIYFNKVAENVYTRRLLDFGVCNIDSSKHLVDKILELDLDLVQTFYRLKKKLMQFQSVSTVMNDLENTLNLHHIWNKEYYSNKLVLSQVYEDRMIIFVEDRNKTIKLIDTFLKTNYLNFYSFSIDENNIYNSGKYFVILEEKTIINGEFIPLLESIFFNDENIILNDSKIIFPFQIDMQMYLGISDNAIFNEVEKLLILINQIKSKKIDYLIFFIVFEVLEQLKSSVVIENLIYTFAGKSILINNNKHLTKSQSCLIDLKNRFFDKKVSISDKEIIQYTKDIRSVNTIYVNEIEILKNQLIKVYSSILNQNMSVLYSVTNLIFNAFEIKDYQKPFIITIVKKIINNES